ncbi:hypothetical protein ACFE04_028546 [Oxalis oulophora]
MLASNLIPYSYSTAVTISKPNRRHIYPINTSSSFSPLLTRAQTKKHNNNSNPFIKVSSFNPINGFPSGFSSSFQPQIKDNVFPSGFCLKSRSLITKAATGSDVDGGDGDVVEPKPQQSKTLTLGIIFGFWYFQNIVFNIFNKKALTVFPYPWLLASFQLFAGSIWMIALWGLKLQPFPKITKEFVIALLGPALFHTIGHISACVSFSKVAVSFTHVIKSAEPVFTVLFSAVLGDVYPLKVWLSILPIVFGCSLAAVTEVSFNYGGLWGAMISNVGFVLRNVYSKKSLQHFKEVNGLNLYGCITILSLFYLFPAAIFVEGSQWVPGYYKAIEAVGKPSTFYLWVLLSGVFYHLYNQSSYQALDEISPLTFSVGNTMKRVVVIVSSVIVFRNPVRPLNALGSAIAILGTFLYSQATAKKKIEGEKKN